MSETSKITASQRQRLAIVYVRQSTLLQLERNRESTARQYDLTERAVALGWPRAAVRVIDEDQGISGARPPAARGSPTSPRRSVLGRWGSCWRWRSRGWHGTTLIGTG